jgi:ATP-dependent Lhr-like helicase
VTAALDLLHPVIAHHVVNTLAWPSLRPLQEAAVGPIAAGQDVLLLAPTAGGKTEAAVFPMLSAMATQGWTGLSVLYLCPVKALVNNLEPRLSSYAGWLGRRVAVWHGDVTESRRAAIRREPPDVLLTTPESVESMLVSTRLDHRQFFAGLRAVVVDELHAFGGDDRGWHLLAVLERLTRVADRPIQRIGLSATIGNAPELLTWLQGSGAGARPGQVVAPAAAPAVSGSEPAAEVRLDHVGSVPNAAKVIASLHRGEKRLVFCDSRSLVEQLGAQLRAAGVTTFLSHASLAVDERRRAEQAFSQARDCVIVATSTLEVGLDAGDLDRVIQVNAPGSVASFLQRIGRSGRRAGSVRNCLLLAVTHDDLLAAAGLLLLWGRGFVERVTPPPEPRHIIAQQLLALCLQERRVGEQVWPQWWAGLAPFGPAARPIVRYLVEEGFLERDSGMLFVGPAAERRFGRRHFMELTTVFTAAPQLTVLCGREEIGRVDPGVLVEETPGPRLVLLGGRTWRVNGVDWPRRRCFVAAAEGPGRARWVGAGTSGTSFALARAMREVLLGAEVPARTTRRGAAALAEVRDRNASTVHRTGSVVVRTGVEDLRWWTWAGMRANATLKATLGDVADQAHRTDDLFVRLRPDLRPDTWRAVVTRLGGRLCLPEVDGKALAGLKFTAALPRHLAAATLAARLADPEAAATVLAEPHRFVTT